MYSSTKIQSPLTDMMGFGAVGETRRQTTTKTAANNIVTTSKPAQVGRPLIIVLHVRVFFVSGTELLSVYNLLMSTHYCASSLDKVSRHVLMLRMNKRLKSTTRYNAIGY